MDDEKTRGRPLVKPWSSVVSSATSPTGMQPLPPPPKNLTVLSIAPTTSIQLVRDWRELSLAQRQGLIGGFRVNITKNGEKFDEIPLSLLETISTKANNHANRHPRMRIRELKLGTSAEPACIRYVLGWLRNNSKAPTVSELPTCQTARDSISVCHAAHELGLDRCYTTKIFKECYSYLKNNTPKYEELEIIEAQATPEFSAFLRPAAVHLGFIVHMGLIADPVDFQHWLDSHPTMQAAIREQVAELQQRGIGRRQKEA
ncbi:hypothetical protein BDV96DRAFT_95235 [Lophiotrema nucula]|uniref:Uncharacterized protein n=1 Tax=Lophiotrema nucula TaxID=690887 RepID=A0A6A5Z5R8_9PLEO|nr:hypothetical protein BDV96DRAFT_95235 [Lophiotrema nucula]